MAANNFQNWRRGEPTQALRGQDSRGFTHWRRGEPLVAMALDDAPQPITGTIAVTIPAPSVAITAEERFEAQLAVTIPAPSVSIDALTDYVTTVAVTIPAPSVSITANVPLTGGRGAPPGAVTVTRTPRRERRLVSLGVRIGAPRVRVYARTSDDEFLLSLLEV